MLRLPHEPSSVSLTHSHGAKTTVAHDVTLTLATMKPPFAHGEITLAHGEIIVVSLTVSRLSVSLSLTISLSLSRYVFLSKLFSTMKSWF